MSPMGRRDWLILGLLLLGLTALSWSFVGIGAIFGLTIDLWSAWMVSGALIYGAMMLQRRRRARKKIGHQG